MAYNYPAVVQHCSAEAVQCEIDRPVGLRSLSVADYHRSDVICILYSYLISHRYKRGRDRNMASHTVQLKSQHNLHFPARITFRPYFYMINCDKDKWSYSEIQEAR